MFGFVVEGEPEAMLAGYRASLVEVIRPFPPLIERLTRVVREARNDEVLMAELFGGIESFLPTQEDS